LSFVYFCLYHVWVMLLLCLDTVIVIHWTEPLVLSILGSGPCFSGAPPE
jgi:hypothetical protein